MAVSRFFARSRSSLPRRGLLVRAAPRHGSAVPGSLAWVHFDGARVVRSGTGAVNALPPDLPVILLLAAQDVVLGRAQVPALSGERLRDMLGNLVEDASLSEPAALHVCIVDDAGDADGKRALATVDRAWLREVLKTFASTGHTISAVYAETLALPWQPGLWTLAVTPEGAALRTGLASGMALPPVQHGAQSLCRLLAGKSAAPQSVDLYGEASAVRAYAEMFEASGIKTRVAGSSALAALVERSASLAVPVSLLQHGLAAAGASGKSARRRYGRAVFLLLLLALVQTIGMQWRWGQLRAERSELRAGIDNTLRQAFPETTVILDAPLQMQRGLEQLRGGDKHGDKGDFVAMVSALGKLFADAPAPPSGRIFARSMEYHDHGLWVHLVPGVAADEAARAVLTQRATDAGYELRFENNADGATAVMRVRNAS